MNPCEWIARVTRVSVMLLTLGLCVSGGSLFADETPPIVKSSTDTDGDGFTDWEEDQSGTDWRNPGSHPNLESGIVGWWKLEERSGTTVFDSSSNGLNGELIGEPLPSLSGSPADVARTFDGEQNEIRVADAPSLTPSNGVTIAAWVRASSGTDGVVAGKWPVEGERGSYTLAILDGCVVMELSLRGTYRPLVSRAVVADEGWHHVAAVYDRFEAKLFVDGIEVVATHTGGPVDGIEEGLVMGHFAGSLQSVRLYGRALTDWEVWLIQEVEARRLGVTRESKVLALSDRQNSTVSTEKRLPGLNDWGRGPTGSSSVGSAKEEGDALP